MKKIYFCAFTLIFLHACQQHNKPQHFFVNENQMQTWLKHRPLIQLQGATEQKDAFAVEHHLVSQQALIEKSQLDKMIFLHNNSRNSQSEPFIKRSIRATVKLDQQQVDDNTAMLMQRQHNKKAKVRLYQIFKNYPLNATAKEIRNINQKMQQIHDQISDLDSFKKFAVAESESQSRLQSGLIGNIAHGKFPPTINDIVMNMKPNQTSDVIIGKQGVLIFYCERIVLPHKQTDQQISERVINTLTNHAVHQAFEKKKQLTINNAHINIDWGAITNAQGQMVAAKSNNAELSNQQLLWLLNGKKGQKELSDFAKKTIENSINNHFLYAAFYRQLNPTAQKQLEEKSRYLLQQHIASEVMALMIGEQLKIPTETDERNYFEAHHKNYIHKPRFSISAIALKLDPQNKVTSHQHTYQLWYDIAHKKITFKQAFAQYSFLNKKYPEGYSISLSAVDIPQVFGIEVSRQIKTMQKGDISLPVASEERGIVWILRLDEVIEAKAMTYEEAQKSIHNTLGNKAAKSLQNDITQSIIDDMVIND